MNEYMRDLKVFWLAMVEPPWRHSSSGNMDERTQMIERDGHCVMWCVGWLWAVAGLVAGALVAPSLVQLVGLADSPYMDWLVIAVAMLAGFLLQVLSWVFIASMSYRTIDRDRARTMLYPANPDELGCSCLVGLFFMGTTLIPIAAVGYGIYRYLTWIGAGQRSVTVAFVGGLLIKTFIIPAIWGAIKSRTFQAFLRWLRGDKVKTKGA